jgi:hypothetical protein
MAKTKLTVVVDEDGRVVATQRGHGNVPDPATGIVASLTPGPGQHVHRIEFDVSRIASSGDVASFHEQLERHLRS